MEFESAHDALASRLQAFAGGALQPDPAAMARIRGLIVGEAARRASATLASAAAVDTERRGAIDAYRDAAFAAARPPALDDRLSARRPLLARLPVAGRLFAPRPPAAALAPLRPSRRLVLMAGALVLAVAAGSGAAAASGPGDPFYGARLWLESAALAPSGPARVTGELGMLDARLADARSAVERLNPNAVSAALAAYEQTAQDAARDVATAADQARLDAALVKGRAALAALAPAASTGPGYAASIRAAIERATATIDAIRAGQLDGRSHGQGGGAPDTSASAGAGQNGQAGGNGNGANGNGANGNGANGNGANGSPSPAASGDHGNAKGSPSPKPTDRSGVKSPAPPPPPTKAAVPTATPDHPAPHATDGATVKGGEAQGTAGG